MSARAAAKSGRSETLAFEAEVAQVLDLMIHSLYTHREIFLRELVSNASDALDKLRFRALTEPGLLGSDEELAIRLETDEEARTLIIADNGVGMTRDELRQNLGTIARSGTKRFLEGLREAKGKNAPDLIGQFGVGFYSAFMVADRVVVETRAAGEEKGWRWSSDGRGSYTIEEADVPARGTRVALHLADATEGDDEPPADFLSAGRLGEVVRKYSDFVEYPIRIDVEREVEKDGKKETVVETKTLNSMRPLWSRDKSEITAEEYAEFYRHLTHDWREPAETIHFRAEGTQQYTALVYLPAERPMDLFDARAARPRLSLYVKRVFITDDCEELLPNWLRFVRGVVDSADLPLNVSRETLQQNRVLKQIRKRLVSKVLDTIAHLAESDREKFEAFWDAFGEILKEAIAMGEDEDDRVANLSLFAVTSGKGRATLGELAERLPAGQDALWVATGTSRAALEASPHLEVFRQRGFEVVLATDPVDECVFDRLSKLGDVPVKRVSRGTRELETDEDRKKREEREESVRGLLDALAGRLGDRVAAVRLSSQLVDSPAVLVAEGDGPSPQLRRMLERSGQELPPARRALELNPDHPVFQRLASVYDEDTQAAELTRYAELLWGQALLFEGEELPDPASFARHMNELLARA